MVPDFFFKLDLIKARSEEMAIAGSQMNLPTSSEWSYSPHPAVSLSCTGTACLAKLVKGDARLMQAELAPKRKE